MVDREDVDHLHVLWFFWKKYGLVFTTAQIYYSSTDSYHKSFTSVWIIRQILKKNVYSVLHLIWLPFNKRKFLFITFLTKLNFKLSGSWRWITLTFLLTIMCGNLTIFYVWELLLSELFVGFSWFVFCFLRGSIFGSFWF